MVNISSSVLSFLLSSVLMNPLSRAHRDSYLMSCMAASHHNDEMRYKYFTFSSYFHQFECIFLYCTGFGDSLSVFRNVRKMFFTVVNLKNLSVNLCGKYFQ